MKVVIQISKKDRGKAWSLLVRHSSGIALRNRIFIISREAARALKKAGVKFTEIAREDVATEVNGVPVNEKRI